MGKRVLVIPDTQAPFQHVDTLDFLIEVWNHYGLDTVVHVGDEIDFHAMSDYSPDPDGYGPGHELDKALEFMHEMYEVFPEVSVCVSNHTSRPFRKAYSAGFPKRFIRDYHEFLEAPPGWDWKDYHEIDGVVYEHGERFGGQYAHLKHALNNMKPTVTGHHHSNAGVIYSANRERLIYGMAVGCLVNMAAYAFKYANKYPRKSILGCGIVIDGIPTFVPMLLDKKGRWVRRLVV